MEAHKIVSSQAFFQPTVRWWAILFATRKLCSMILALQNMEEIIFMIFTSNNAPAYLKKNFILSLIEWLNFCNIWKQILSEKVALVKPFRKKYLYWTNIQMFLARLWDIYGKVIPFTLQQSIRGDWEQIMLVRWTKGRVVALPHRHYHSIMRTRTLMCSKSTEQRAPEQR